MNSILNINDMLEMDQTLNDINSKYEKFNIPIDPTFFNNYDLIYIKDKILKLIKDVKTIPYFNSLSYQTKVTASYEERLGSSQRSNISQVEQAVDHYVDEQLRATCIFDSLKVVATKLTKAENIYMIDAILANYTEEQIASDIGICKVTLQKIKKSCLIKMWIELEKYVKSDE